MDKIDPKSNSEVPVSSIQITVNGELHTVTTNDASLKTSLVEYLRNVLTLTGTKTLCHEGGCCLCTVVATSPDPLNPGSYKKFSVLACRQMLYACNGWSIDTTEGLGNWRNGYHPIQNTLAGFYGTQCGYCSPGMVMAMHGQLESKESVTSEEVERSLDGNLCRCTGYRPILDAFKSFATDGSQTLKNKLIDIEESYKTCNSKVKTDCRGKCGCVRSERSEMRGERSGVYIMENGVEWYQPSNLQELYTILNNLGVESSYQLVVGNTAQGVYKMGPYSTYINTTNLSELYQVNQETSNIILGANISCARAIEIFKEIASTTTGFHHLESIAKHWLNVANTSVRNTGSIAGNLIMKHDHPEFQSDLFVTLVGCEAQLNIVTALDGSTETVNLENFLNLDMNKKVILSVSIPSVSNNVKLRSYKITPRAVNAHAYINAVVKMNVDPDNFTIIERPIIVYGGINPQFLHAKLTEDFLLGKSLTDPNLVINACQILETEVNPDNFPQNSSPEYRSALTQNILYKAILSIQAELGLTLPSEVISGGSLIERPVSSGQQNFTTNEDRWPVGKPIPKVEALPQVAGETKYMNDEPSLKGELVGVFVQSSQGKADIISIDLSQALTVPGVVAVLTAADIPGVNNAQAQANPVVEEIFAANKVIYAGQAIGLVVAQNYSAAQEGAHKVTVEYGNVETPILTISDAIEKGSIIAGTEVSMGNVQDAFSNSSHVLSGSCTQGFQQHFTMEVQGARVTPIEDGYDVIATTIWPAEAQAVVAQVLGLDASSVNVEVRRVGGSFGSKINRSHPVVGAAAVAAWHIHKPVRVTLSISEFMTLLGGRDPYYTTYKVGFDNTGKINGFECDTYADAGCLKTDETAGLAVGWLPNVYFCPNWLLKPWTAITNTPSNTFMRAPGITNGIITIETAIDHIANYLGLDPLTVREANLANEGDLKPNNTPFPPNIFALDILPLLKETAQWDLRSAEVADFNSVNRWKKRGISLMPMCFNIAYGWFRFAVIVNIYAHDGTVSISAGGIEQGQGINTKITQIAASILGVEIEKIKIKSTSTTSNANSWHNGASVCSDIVCNGVKKACENIMERISEFKARYEVTEKKETSWPELLKLCRDNDVDISERIWTRDTDLTKTYDIFGGAVTEVEIDMLTGQTQIRRVDVIEDCGQSLSPYVDIGQVEGALIMGLGMMMTEKIVYDSTTGQKLTTGTWEYKPLSALDIPVDLRVTLLPNSFNDSGVLRAKAIGEPPHVLSYGVVMALRMAISAARVHSSNTDWFNLDTPVTVENVQRLCLVTPSQFITAE